MNESTGVSALKPPSDGESHIYRVRFFKIIQHGYNYTYLCLFRSQHQCILVCICRYDECCRNLNIPKFPQHYKAEQHIQWFDSHTCNIQGTEINKIQTQENNFALQIFYIIITIFFIELVNTFLQKEIMQSGGTELLMLNF